MLLGNDAYNKFTEYVENNINFEFLSHIPGYDKSYEVQKESIIKLIKKSNNNEAFIDYAAYTYQTLKSICAFNIKRYNAYKLYSISSYLQ